MSKIARWFIDIQLDSETLRWWSGTGDISLDGETYTGLGTRWKTPDSLKRKASLKSEKIELEFDSSRQSDNSDPIGGLLDEKWRNRAIRLRRLMWAPGETPDDGDLLSDERGRIRNLSDSLKAGDPATLTMEIESGALAYLERRDERRSSASQKRVFPGDKGFDLIADLEGRTLAWRTKYEKTGTVKYELQEEYEPEPRKLLLGRFVNTGSFVAAWTNQQQNKSLVRVYALVDHRINKLDKVWVNGELVHSTPLVHGQRTELTYFRDPKGNGGPGAEQGQRAWITFYDGRPDQVADSFQAAASGPWTSAHRLRGVAYVIMEHRWDSDLANSYDYRFGGEGARLYDRRKDSTQGGSGSHRWDDPSTHEYSTNAMVAADHYRIGMRIMSGSTALWFGVGEDIDAVPYAEFKELADHCDDLIALKGGLGTQKRYEVNGVLTAKDEHKKNLQKLADQMAAQAIDDGGRIAFRPPIIRTPVITLTDGDTVRESESVADPGGRIDDMVNTLSGRFINPANQYKKDDYPEVSIASYVEDDNGEISDTLDLDLEISGERSQRIAKLRIEDSRRIFEMEETYTSKARVIVPGEWFVRESVIRGFPDGKTFIADEVEKYIDGTVRVRSVEVDPDQLVWDEETAVDLSEPPAFDQLVTLPLADPDMTLTPRPVTEGSVTIPGLDIEIDYGADGDEIEYETDVEIVRDDGNGVPLAGSEVITRRLTDSSNVLTVSGDLMPGVDYLIRKRPRFDGRVGDWSDWVPFTASSGYSVPASIASPGGALQAALDDFDTDIGNAQSAISGAQADATLALSRGQTALDNAAEALDRLDPIDTPGTGRLDVIETEQFDQAQRIEAVRFRSGAVVPPPLRADAGGSVAFAKNEASDGSPNAGEIRITAGFIDHPVTGRFEQAVDGVVLTGVEGGYNPPDNTFYLVMSQASDLQSRFPSGNYFASERIFVAAYDSGNDQWVRYDRNSSANYNFDPLTTDVCVAVGTKADGSTEIDTLTPVFAGMAEINSRVVSVQTATDDLASDFNALSITVDGKADQADLNATNQSLSQVQTLVDNQGDLIGTNASDISTLQADYSSLSDEVDTKASLTQLSDAQADNEGARTQLLIDAKAYTDTREGVIEAAYTNYVDTEVSDVAGRVTSLESFEVATNQTLASYDTLITANADDLTAQGSIVSSLSVTASRRNYLPPQYRLMWLDNRDLLHRQNAVTIGTGDTNYFDESKASARYDHDDRSDDTMVIYCADGSASYNMPLEGGKTYIVAVRCNVFSENDNPGWFWYPRLRNSSGQFFTPSSATSQGEHAFLFDLTGEPAGTYNFSVWVRGLSDTGSSLAFIPYAWGVFEQVGDTMSYPPLGEGLVSATQEASIRVVQTTVADIEGNTAATYGIRLDGGGGGTFFSLEDGTALGSTITLSASDIILDGDVIITGTLTRDRLAAGEGDALTAEGVASNYYSQATDPAPVANGSFWFDSGNNELNIRIGGAWSKIANITAPGGSGPSFSASITGLLYASAPVGNDATASLSLNITGGSGNFTYTWSLRDSFGSSISVNNNGLQSSIGYTKTIETSDPSSYTVECRIVDTDTGETIYPTNTITFDEL